MLTAYDVPFQPQTNQQPAYCICGLITWESIAVSLAHNSRYIA